MSAFAGSRNLTPEFTTFSSIESIREFAGSFSPYNTPRKTRFQTLEGTYHCLNWFLRLSDRRIPQPPSPFGHASSEPPDPRHLLITASFGRILPASILHLFVPGRRLNVHPSLLPAYRGAAPIQRALMNGEPETGVCIIEMMERKRGIDAGGIWGCTRLVSMISDTHSHIPPDVDAPGRHSLSRKMRRSGR